MSSRATREFFSGLTVFVLAGLPVAAQYPGQVATADKNAPEMRAVSVLEWTGDEQHPKASRMVPVSVFDGQQLQDGGIYLASPEPLALEGEVEYQLKDNGKNIGLFVIQNAALDQGAWVGYGSWKAIPKPKAAVASPESWKEDDEGSDRPTLHRKAHPDEGSGKDGSGGGSSSGGSGSGSQGPAPDPDRPTLHRSADSGSGDSGSTNSGSGNSGSGNSGSGSTSSAPASDPDRPTLHRSDSSSSGSSSSGSSSSGSSSSGSGSNSGDSSNSGSGSSGQGTAPDPDRPVLHKGSDETASNGNTNGGNTNGGNTNGSDSDRPKLKKKKNDDDEGSVSSLPDVSDPNRPRLIPGKAADMGPTVLPSLTGLPPDMQQQVAVSDSKNTPEHIWGYSWADPADEAKYKGDLEDLARTALGLKPPPAPAKPAAKKTAAKKTGTTHKTRLTLPPPPEPLVDEQFHVFELAYGSGATLVLSARTAGTGAAEKFVTIVAQPDLYGNLTVLLKNVTDAAHLDDTPRMRLVDAVDAMADNRGELLFELRGQSQRQFALYRVLRGQATRLFVSSGDSIGATATAASE